MASLPIQLSTKQNPIACTLSDIDAVSQLEEWRVLRSKALSALSIDKGIRLVVPVELAETVQDLAARERACCSFLSIIVDVRESEIDIAITSADPAGQAVVEALAGLS